MGFVFLLVFLCAVQGVQVMPSGNFSGIAS
nr:MAG TPA: hypothetical protein [Caudoviricetes sp.]